MCCVDWEQGISTHVYTQRLEDGERHTRRHTAPSPQTAGTRPYRKRARTPRSVGPLLSRSACAACVCARRRCLQHAPGHSSARTEALPTTTTESRAPSAVHVGRDALDVRTEAATAHSTLLASRAASAVVDEHHLPETTKLHLMRSISFLPSRQSVFSYVDQVRPLFVTRIVKHLINLSPAPHRAGAPPRPARRRRRLRRT